MPRKKTTWRERLRSKRFTSVSGREETPRWSGDFLCLKKSLFRNHRCCDPWCKKKLSWIFTVPFWRIDPTILHCWWFRNPANQLRLVVYPIIYRVLYILSVVGLGISEPSTVCVPIISFISFIKKHRVDQGNNTSFKKPWHLWRKNNPNLSSHFPHVHVAIFDKQIPGKQPLACCSFSINFILKTSHPVA